MPQTNLAAEVAALVTIVKQLDARAAEDRKERKEYHKELAESLEADREASVSHRESVKDELARMRQVQSDTLTRVEKLEPVVNMFSSLHSKILGALAVLGIIGGIVTSTMLFFKEKLAAMLWG